MINGALGEDEIFGGTGDDLLKAAGGQPDLVLCGPGDDIAPEVSADLSELAGIDEALVDAAITQMAVLRDNPWAGDDLWERYNLRPVKGCRKLRFDVGGWTKPRYRIVYRNEPLDGAPGLVRVWAVGPRSDLFAYARAATRISSEEAEKRLRRRRRDR